jgi:hypothetical protein
MKGMASEQKTIKTTVRKTSLGNYRIWSEGYYSFVRWRPHGGLSVGLYKNGKYIVSEGLHGISIPNLESAIMWIDKKILKHKSTPRH